MHTTSVSELEWGGTLIGESATMVVELVPGQGVVGGHVFSARDAGLMALDPGSTFWFGGSWTVRPTICPSGQNGIGCFPMFRR